MTDRDQLAVSFTPTAIRTRFAGTDNAEALNSVTDEELTAAAREVLASEDLREQVNWWCEEILRIAVEGERA